jgi:hypothetical protein
MSTDKVVKDPMPNHQMNVLTCAHAPTRIQSSRRFPRRQGKETFSFPHDEAGADRALAGLSPRWRNTETLPSPLLATTNPGSSVFFVVT